jgi:hypothetical protein
MVDDRSLHTFMIISLLVHALFIYLIPRLFRPPEREERIGSYTQVQFIQSSLSPVRTKGHRTGLQPKKQKPIHTHSQEQKPVPVQHQVQEPVFVKPQVQEPVPGKHQAREPAPVRHQAQEPVLVQHRAQSPVPAQPQVREPVPVQHQAQEPVPVQPQAQKLVPIQRQEQDPVSVQLPVKGPDFLQPQVQKHVPAQAQERKVIPSREQKASQAQEQKAIQAKDRKAIPPAMDPKVRDLLRTVRDVPMPSFDLPRHQPREMQPLPLSNADLRNDLIDRNIGDEVIARQKRSSPATQTPPQPREVSSRRHMQEDLPKPVPEELDFDQEGPEDEIVQAGTFSITSDIEWQGRPRGIVRKPDRPPRYPEGYRGQTQGRIRLKFWVDNQGYVIRVIPMQKLDPRLDAVATDYLRQYRFEPVSKGKRGELEWGIIPFSFHLE